MNIFGVGGAELVLIFIIMLVVAGPQRMLRWAYIAGKYAAQLRVMWDRMVEMIQAEIDEAGMDVELPREIPTRQNIDKWFREQARDVTEPLDEDVRRIKGTLKDADTSLKTGTKSTAKQATTSDDAATASDDSDGQPRTAPQRRTDNRAVSMGSWDDQPTTANDLSDAADENDDSNFGAWTTPRHPGDVGSQDAETTEAESERS